MPYPSTSLYPSPSLYPEYGSEVVPTVSTGGATDITSTGATLGGTVNPNGLETHYYFEYGLSELYGFRFPVEVGTNIGNGTADVAISRPVSGFRSGTYFHYRLVAWNGYGFSYGDDQALLTLYGEHDPQGPSFFHQAGRGQ